MKTLGKLILLAAVAMPLMLGALSTRAATGPEIEDSIEAGLAYLAAEQRPDGSWGDPGWSAEGATGLAVLKFEERARELGLDPFDPAYAYHQQVEDGLNYLFSRSQVAGGFVWITTFGGNDNYDTGIGMMALAASRNPGRIVPALGSPVDGWSYMAVLQGMLDWMEDGQNDGNCEAGGWGYSANFVGWSDQSNTGYSTLGIGYATSPIYGFGLTVDPNVLAKLDTWINNVQHPVTGGSGYMLGGPPPCGSDGGSILRTGNLLYEMALVGRPLADPTVQAAINFIENAWPGWMGDSQATFTMMKGLTAYGIEKLTVGASEIDWFDEVSTFIVSTQNPDGSWPIGWGLHLDTAWNLLTLEKAVAVPTIRADIAIVGQGFFPCKTPNRLTVSVPTEATLRKVIHNNGPLGPVEVGVAGGIIPAAGCDAWLKEVPAPVEVPVSVDVVVDEVFVLHCYEPGEKTFQVWNFIWPTDFENVIDPVWFNNIRDTSLTLEAVPPLPPGVDYAVTSLAPLQRSFLNPARSYIVSYTASVRNVGTVKNGPATFSLIAPPAHPGCPAPKVEPIGGYLVTLDPGEGTTRRFNVTYGRCADASPPLDYTPTAIISAPGDTVPGNDTMSGTVNVFP